MAVAKKAASFGAKVRRWVAETDAPLFVALVLFVLIGWRLCTTHGAGVEGVCHIRGGKGMPRRGEGGCQDGRAANYGAMLLLKCWYSGVYVLHGFLRSSCA